MKKVTYIRMTAPPEENFGMDDGGTGWAFKLHQHCVEVRKKLQKAGFEFYSLAELPPEEADIVFCFDLRADIFERLKKLPPATKKILQCYETTLYAPLCNSAKVLAHPMWEAILCWNYSYEADHIIRYDLPFAGKTLSQLPDVPVHPGISEKTKGAVISSYKSGDHRGLAPCRDRFYEMLAEKNHIDLYGQCWTVDFRKNRRGPSPNKIETFSNYPFALVVENMLSPGYVTEKLPDCILAGIPTIYYGDFHHAQRRFPGTFIPLQKLDEEGFLEAREKLFEQYETLQKNVLKSRDDSDTWGNNYIDTMLEIFLNIK